MMITLNDGISGLMENWVNVINETLRVHDETSKTGVAETASKLMQLAPTDTIGARTVGVRLACQALE